MDDDDDDDDGRGGGDAGGGHGRDDDDDDDDAESTSAAEAFADHRFLVGSSMPSMAKFSYEDRRGVGMGDGVVVETMRPDDDDDDDGGDRINRLHLLTYREYDHELIESSSYVHPSGEIWSMACHPTRSEYVVTCGGGGTMYHPEDIYDNDDDGGGSRKNAGGGQGRDCR